MSIHSTQTSIDAPLYEQVANRICYLASNAGS